MCARKVTHEEIKAAADAALKHIDESTTEELIAEFELFDLREKELLAQKRLAVSPTDVHHGFD